MWISELSERTGVPVDTIKHYLRVGVLPRGELVGPLRAEYDESHVERLNLVRALHDVGHLPLEQIRRVFDSIDSSQESLRNAVGEAHMLLSTDLATYQEPSAESLRQVDDLIDRHGWDVEESSTHRPALAVALDVLRSVDTGLADESTSRLLEVYADHAELVAREELGYVDPTDRRRMLSSVVAGTVLLEPLVLLVRRLAQQHTSRTWWAEERWRELADQPDDTAPPG